MYTITILVILVFMFLAASIRILNEYERAVIFRLGRIIDQKGPGLIILIPVVDKMVKVDMRTITLDVPPQDVITRDNVSIKVNAVVYFRVIDANALSLMWKTISTRRRSLPRQPCGVSAVR